METWTWSSSVRSGTPRDLGTITTVWVSGGFSGGQTLTRLRCVHVHVCIVDVIDSWREGSRRQGAADQWSCMPADDKERVTPDGQFRNNCQTDTAMACKRWSAKGHANWSTELDTENYDLYNHRDTSWEKLPPDIFLNAANCIKELTEITDTDTHTSTSTPQSRTN